MKANTQKTLASFGNILNNAEMEHVIGGRLPQKITYELGNYIYTEYYDSDGNLTSFSIYNKTTNHTTF